jgi:hypothetical protein
MGVPQPERSELPVPLSTEEQDRLVAALTDAAPDVAAAYVAAVGANLIGAPAVGGSVAAGEQVGFVVRDERRNIIGVLEPLARPVAGVPVGEGSWRALRQVAARTGVDFDQDRAIATYAALALCESGTVSPFPGAVLIRRYRLSRRLIDNVRPHLTGSDPVEIARLLRGDPSPVRGAA